MACLRKPALNPTHYMVPMASCVLMKVLNSGKMTLTTAMTNITRSIKT